MQVPTYILIKCMYDSRLSEHEVTRSYQSVCNRLGLFVTPDESTVLHICYTHVTTALQTK